MRVSIGGGTSSVACGSSTLDFVKGLFEGAAAKVSFGEHAPGNAGAGDQVQRGAAHGKTDAEIDRAAQAYMRQHKVNYSEAVAAVTAPSFEA